MFICGHGSFRFDMAPFCILSDHDSFISYTYVGSAYLYGDVLYMDVYVPEISFLTFISLSGTFTRAFRSWILCSLSILGSFLYNVFRLSSSPLTSHIRGHLLYTRMAPLHPSVDFPHVGTQKDTYGLRFSQNTIAWLIMEYISAFIHPVTLPF